MEFDSCFWHPGTKLVGPAHGKHGMYCPECQLDANKALEAMSEDKPEFKREYRYIVVKKKKLTERQRELLDMVLNGADIPTVECVVIEEDWPIYDEAWELVGKLEQENQK